ncbi:MAG: phosphonate C-P lyase system protein PhnH [Pseudomonadota bacterium]
MEAHSLEGGLSDAPVEAAVAFRAALDAMSRPGNILTVSGAEPPVPLSVAAGTLLLTLCDPETPLALAPSIDLPSIRDWVIFHTGAPIVGPERCMFAVGRWDELHPLSRFLIGTSEYPDRSATLIVETETLSPDGARLSGPGIADQTALNLPDVSAFQANNALFPLGLDFIFTAGSEIAALPRTTRVEAA